MGSGVKARPLHDVGVVGGGPAGATAAFLLARRGFRVTLFDQRCFPRPKLCAGLLTWKTIRLLDELFGERPETLAAAGIIVQTCRDFRIVCDRRELARGRLEYPFYLVDRARYDHYWLKKALQSGVRLRQATLVTRVEADGRLYTAGGGEYRFDVIVGADGVLSRVRRCLLPNDADRRRWRIRLAGTLEAKYPTLDRNACASLHFGYAPQGYAWSFPNPQGQIMGICGLSRKERKTSLKHAFERFLADCAVDGASRADWNSHPLPYGNFLSKSAGGCLLLVGDACGLADPLLGEGIFYAHRSAQLAALAIARCRYEPDGMAARYRRLLNRRILRELRWMAFYRRLLFFGARLWHLRGLGLLFRLFPARLEALVQGRRPFSRFLLP